MSITDEEAIAGGKILCRAYYLGADYNEDYSQRRADEVTMPHHQWAKQAMRMADLGHPVIGNAGPITGASITGAAFLRKAEQLGEDVKASLKAEEKKPEPNKKLLAQWRFAYNCFFGATHKRGLIPDLKDAGPGAY